MTLKLTDGLVGGHLNVRFRIKAEQREVTEQRKSEDCAHGAACNSQEGKRVNQQLFSLVRLKARFPDSLTFIGIRSPISCALLFPSYSRVRT